MADGRRQSGRRVAHRGVWAAVLPLAALAILCTVGGLGGLAQHLRSDAPRAYRVPAALVLLALAAVQVRLAWRIAAAQRRDGSPPITRSPRDYGRVAAALGAYGVAAYLAALCLGPDPAVRYLLRALLAAGATVAAWQCLATRPAAMAPTSVAGVWLRRGWTVACAALWLLAGGEAALRCYGRWFDPQAALAWQAEELIRASRPGQGTADASLADGITTNSSGQTPSETVLLLTTDAAKLHLATANGQRRRGAALVQLAVPAGQPAHWAALFARQPIARRSQRVLLLVDCATLARPCSLPCAFDWRSLHLVQRTGFAARWGTGSDHSDGRGGATSVVDTEAQLALQLAVCRTPMGEFMQCRWRETETALAQLVRSCDDCGATLGVVILPAPHQVEAGLRQRLCQRFGVAVEELDPELPQRRVAGAAAALGVPALDLTATLRTARCRLCERDAACWNAAGCALAGQAIAAWIDAAPETLARRDESAAR